MCIQSLQIKSISASTTPINLNSTTKMYSQSFQNVNVIYCRERCQTESNFKDLDFSGPASHLQNLTQTVVHGKVMGVGRLLLIDIDRWGSCKTQQPGHLGKREYLKQIINHFTSRLNSNFNLFLRNLKFTEINHDRYV